MPHINLLISVYTLLKNAAIADAMLQFFALSKPKLMVNIQYGILYLNWYYSKLKASVNILDRMCLIDFE